MKPTRIDRSRRSLLLGAAGAMGAMAMPRIGRHRFLGNDAHAQAAEKPVLVIVNLLGGYNSIFTGADAFTGSGSFGVTGSNVQSLGNGLVVDKSTYGTMPAFALSHMASIGVRHGFSGHSTAQTAFYQMRDLGQPTKSYAGTLADAMGGSAALKAVSLSSARIFGFPDAIGGTAFQRLSDLGSTVAALGGAAPDPSLPDRAIAKNALTASKSMSSARLTASPGSLGSVGTGYDKAVGTLAQPAQSFSYGAMATAYGVPQTATALDSFRMQMLGAELMVLAGANVILTVAQGWDTHADVSASSVRAKMSSEILPSLNIFLNRTLAMTGRNVVTMVAGEFARSLPGSDHQHNLSVSVMGKYVKLGTTGRTDASVNLPDTTPTYAGMWAYLTQALKMTTSPFGANPHGLVL